jgi:hypothetical protein
MVKTQDSFSQTHFAGLPYATVLEGKYFVRSEPAPRMDTSPNSQQVQTKRDFCDVARHLILGYGYGNHELLKYKAANRIFANGLSI